MNIETLKSYSTMNMKTLKAYSNMMDINADYWKIKEG